MARNDIDRTTAQQQKHFRIVNIRREFYQDTDSGYTISCWDYQRIARWYKLWGRQLARQIR